ncbi:hypothetical protein ONE63_006933 [Megalurothrips usitatus]|uniref:Uncharacterized protein n=1 Tax=Megalurothrips usitatus TaxID=439358 RepID=A0AAV7XQF6_9NEOP|nr:hypothetical protein ONE63_006933 [Megalurothrips usitatus]
MRWEDVASWRDIPSGAVWCGFQFPNNDTTRRERSYVARLYRSGSVIPGKATYWGASAALATSVYSGLNTFEVAVVDPRRVLWVVASGGSVPSSGSPVAGITREGQPLYACRFHLDRHLSMACGAVQRYTERCVAEMDGGLVSSPVYEVLTMTPSAYEMQPPPPPPPPVLPPLFAPRALQDDVEFTVAAPRVTTRGGAVPTRLATAASSTETPPPA